MTLQLPTVKYPLYTTFLPSTGAPIKYRPHNVGEEKVLLTANESEDPEQIKLALKQVLTACVTGAPPIEDWASFDIEFIYMQIRSKSVGNMLDFSIHLPGCPEKELPFELCDVEIPTRINLDEVKLTVKKDDGTEIPHAPGQLKLKTQIKLADELGVQLRYPSYDDIDIVKSMPADATEDDLGLEMIVRCTVNIFDKDQVYPCKDMKKDALKAWYQTLSREQLTLIDNFFKELPTLRYTCKVKCKKCGKDGEYTLEGIASFFG